MHTLESLQSSSVPVYNNLINNFSIIACGARRARSCATALLLTGAQHTLRAGIVRDDRELFHQIITIYYEVAQIVMLLCTSMLKRMISP